MKLLIFPNEYLKGRGLFFLKHGTGLFAINRE
jgi:hypothetical protein